MNLQFWHVDKNDKTDSPERTTLFSGEGKGVAATVYNCGPDAVLVIVADKDGTEDSFDVMPLAAIELTGVFRLAVQAPNEDKDCRGLFAVRRKL